MSIHIEDSRTDASVQRETVRAKAIRYLTEAIGVTRVEGRTIDATCRGDGNIYRLGRNARGWWCECPVTGGRCSHLVALGHVTALQGDHGIGLDTRTCVANAGGDRG